MKLILITSMAIMVSCTAVAQKKDYLITLHTSQGTGHLILFDETPLHKQNFIKLVKSKYYNDLLFHRVIENFVIQGGDPNSKTAKKGERLGNGGPDYKIPFEFTPKRVHIKGALAAASDGNPEKQSNGSQFYIVQGKKLTDDEITMFEKANQLSYTNAQRAAYMVAGGKPSLDNRYTVFGQMIDNLTLIDTIAQVKKDQADRPIEDIKMGMKVKKMSKKKIEKKYGYSY
jgi:cyclophilin family peptidyl-prolyl cis-trans isomerase